MGNQKRYQQWFATAFLSRPENETLIPDLIRYICGVYHPPNQILCSDVVPRWAVIGWLLKSVKVTLLS
jgi:integrator complex subunit 3